MPVIPVLWTAFFLVNFNVAMMIPLLPFIERDIGLSPTQAGLVLAAFPVAALVSNLALGPFIDRFGRKRFIVLGAAACALLFVVTALCRGAVPIALARAATGLFMPMVGASIFAGIADYIPQERRAGATGFVTTAAPIAFLVSMSLGVLGGGLLAWQVPVLGIAFVAAGLAACAAALPPTPADALAAEGVTAGTYRSRLLSLSPDTGTRLLLLAYACWAAAVYVFLGLYPSWAIQRGLPGYGPGTVGTLLFIGEVGGLLGAFLSGRLAGLVRRPTTLCAFAAFAAAVTVFAVPLGPGTPAFQALVYWAFAFGRDLMLALILGSAMNLVAAAQRGSLNAALNAIYQTGGTIGGMASAVLYGLDPGYTANGAAAALLFTLSGALLWGIGRTRPAA